MAVHWQGYSNGKVKVHPAAPRVRTKLSNKEIVPCDPGLNMDGFGSPANQWMQVFPPCLAFSTDWGQMPLPFGAYAPSPTAVQPSSRLTSELLHSEEQFKLTCSDQMATGLQHEEVGSAAWAQAVKHAAQPETESTRCSLGSDNMDARTSEDSSFELDSPHPQELLRSPTALPVKHTFIHFEDALRLRTSKSAPDILCTTPFQRIRNPEMEVAHFRGECRPCAYFVHKTDGCRWGTECTFCHLCPPEAVKAKRKEKNKVMRAEFQERRQLSRQWQSSSHWRKQSRQLRWT